MEFAHQKVFVYYQCFSNHLTSEAFFTKAELDVAHCRFLDTLVLYALRTPGQNEVVLLSHVGFKSFWWLFTALFLKKALNIFCDTK